MNLTSIKFRRELFTNEELERLMPLIDNGEYTNLMDVLDIVDPPKEYEIQKVVNALKPLSEGFVSNVRKQMDEEIPNGPQTPAEEAVWEKKLQKEFKDYSKESEAKREAIEDSLEKKVEEKVEDTKEELIK